MSIKEIFKNLFLKSRYMYVPPCPRCGSKKTGYIINSFDMIQQDLDTEKIRRLLNGELVELNKFVSDEKTLFCNECLIQWRGEPTVRYLTYEEVEKEKEERGITEEYIYLRNNTRGGRALMRAYIKQKRKEEKKQRKKQKSNEPKIKTASSKKEKIKIKK